jgi:hypothetical protein
MQAMQRFFNLDLTIYSMVSRIKEMVSKLPTFMGQIVKYGVLVGLRPAEIIESVKLTNNQLSFSKYYKTDNHTLEHFRFPDIFIRATKKAYISFVTPEILEIARYTEQCPSYNAIRLACQKIGIKMDMRYCRKIFAS